MELLGDRSWWLPRWLDRLLPDLDVEGRANVNVPDSTPAFTNGVGARRSSAGSAQSRPARTGGDDVLAEPVGNPPACVR